MNSGENCNVRGCIGFMKTYKTQVLIAAGYRVRSLECNVCRNRPEGNKVTVPLKFAPIQPRKKTKAIN